MKLTPPSGISEEDILGYECKHAVYVTSNYKRADGIRDDLIFIKEVVHLKDGRKIPHKRWVINFKRPFWVTKEGFRKHQEKKDWEKVERLMRFTCTQAELPYAAKKALNIHSPTLNMKEIAMNPYLYGTDITPTAIIKQWYMKTWPNCVSRNSVCLLDIETDVNKGTKDPIMISITMKERVYHVVTKQFLDGMKDYPERLQQKARELMGDQLDSRGIKIVCDVANSPLHAIELIYKEAHQWMPDVIAIFNIDFDIVEIMKTIRKYGGNEHEIMSDPDVPQEFKYAYYQEGQRIKKTAAGDETSLDWYDQWHTLIAPATWYTLDQACCFRRVRLGDGKEPSMSLDALLKKYTKTEKLHVDVGEDVEGLRRHMVMQAKFKVEYGVYNIADCVRAEILDEQPKIMDLASTIYSQCGFSDYANFSKQPRRTCDKLHFFCLQHGYVIASTPKTIESKFDKMVSHIDGWIVTLATHNKVINGLRCIEELPNYRTGISVANYDLDVTGAYPTGEDTMNASKSTTRGEISKIQGVSEETRRAAGVNLTAGTMNAVQICCSVLGAPTFDMLCKEFERQHTLH
jgi:hypothetical protein